MQFQLNLDSSSCEVVTFCSDQFTTSTSVERHWKSYLPIIFFYIYISPLTVASIFMTTITSTQKVDSKLLMSILNGSLPEICYHRTNSVVIVTIPEGALIMEEFRCGKFPQRHLQLQSKAETQFTDNISFQTENKWV